MADSAESGENPVGGVEINATGGANDMVILIIALLGLGGIIYGIMMALKDPPKKKKKKEKDEEEEEVPGMAAGKKGRVKGAARKRGLAGMKKKKKKAEESEEEESEEEIPDEMLTKKELLKREKKREKAEYKAFMDAQKEEKDKRVNAREAAYRKKEEDREAAEREREELAKKEEEERKQKEQEEFERWKEMFSVEGEGAANEGAANEYQGLLGLFIEYIKKNKVVVLEELASEFGLSATEAVERVELLEELKRISGIVDDRGKFIYVTVEDMKKVAQFIMTKGRSNITDITEECNKIVDFSSDAAEGFSKDREQVELLSPEDAGIEVESEGKDNPGGRK